MKRSYDLAFALLACDAEMALRVVIKSMSEWDVDLAKQNRRTSYKLRLKRAKYKVRSDRVPNKFTLSRAAVLQYSVCANTVDYEVVQEDAFRAERAMLPERTMILRFVKHALHESFGRSFNATVGMCRVLHKYDHATTKRIYGVLAQRDQNRPEEGRPDDKPDEDYRRWKMVLVDKLEMRFKAFVRTFVGHHSERRFIPNEQSGAWYGYIRECLALLTPWGTEHVLPLQFDPRKFDIAGLSFDGKCWDEWHRAEESRMHTIIDPECFSRVVKACEGPAPEQQVDVPRFNGVDEGEGGDSARIDRPPDMTSAQMGTVIDELERMGARRGAAVSPYLSVEVDGVALGRLNTAEASSLRLKLDPDSKRIQVFTTDAEGKLLMASLWLNLIGVAPGEPWDSSLVLEGGQRLGITLNPSAPDDADGCYVVDLSYREGYHPRRLARRLRQFGTRLAARPLLVPRAAYYGVPAVLLFFVFLAGPLRDASRHLFREEDLPQPAVAANNRWHAPPVPVIEGDLLWRSFEYGALECESSGFAANYPLHLLPKELGSRGLRFSADGPADGAAARYLSATALALSMLDWVREQEANDYPSSLPARYEVALKSVLERHGPVPDPVSSSRGYGLWWRGHVNARRSDWPWLLGQTRPTEAAFNNSRWRPGALPGFAYQRSAMPSPLIAPKSWRDSYGPYLTNNPPGGDLTGSVAPRAPVNKPYPAARANHLGPFYSPWSKRSFDAEVTARWIFQSQPDTDFRFDFGGAQPGPGMNVPHVFTARTGNSNNAHVMDGPVRQRRRRPWLDNGTYPESETAGGDVVLPAVGGPPLDPADSNPVVSLEANQSTLTLVDSRRERPVPVKGCTPTPTSLVLLSATVSKPGDGKLRPTWSTTGGRIRGDGLKVLWDLSGVPEGTYTTSVTVDDGRGAVVSSTVRVNIIRCKCEGEFGNPIVRG